MLPVETIPELFTIGHSNRDIDTFVAMLVAARIAVVADVRSSPHSAHSPHFDREILRRALAQRSIDYEFLGTELGARRTEAECYRDAVAEYDLIARCGAFARGIERLRAGMRRQRVALLCAEKDPLFCHRAILICRQLRNDASIRHIIEPDRTESQREAESRLLDLLKLPQRDLFRSREELLEEAYSKQGNRIAYRRDLPATVGAWEGD